LLRLIAISYPPSAIGCLPSAISQKKGGMLIGKTEEPFADHQTYKSLKRREQSEEAI
jgi:hypothetical protein